MWSQWRPDCVCSAADCSIDIAVGFDVSRRSGAPDEPLVSNPSKLREIFSAVSTVRDLCCIKTPVKTNLAFRVVGSQDRLIYDTNFEPYSEAVVRKVLNLQLVEPTSFTENLLHSFLQKLRQSKAGVKVGASSCSCSSISAGQKNPQIYKC